MSIALLGIVLICCSSSAAGAGTFFGGFIPDTSPFIAKKLKKIIQLIITGDAKPIDCANLYNYMEEIKGKPAAESAVQSLSGNEKIIGERVYDIGREGVSPEKICDKRAVDLAIEFFKKIQKAPEGEDVLGFCNDLKDIGDERKDKKHPIYFWDESKKEFVKDDIYFSNALGGKSGPELDGPIIAKCEAAGVNIR